MVLCGPVVTGDARGRELGFPTANVAVDSSTGVADLDGATGVHAAWAETEEGERHAAVANIGRRPTFGGDARLRVEVHLLDFEGSLYDRHLRVTLVRKLRDERRFASAEDLAAQIERDIEEARAACGGAG